MHMAKEVSVRLHDELEFVEEKRLRVEEENRQLKEELEGSERDRIKLQNDIDRMKIEVIFTHILSICLCHCKSKVNLRM